jgi:hypothetical protein
VDSELEPDDEAKRPVPRWVWICTGLAVAGVMIAIAAPSVFSSETTGIVVASAAASVTWLSLLAIAAWGIGLLLYEATKNG